MDHGQSQPHLVTLLEHANPLQEDHQDHETDTMFLNIGPHHPSTHGVLHLETMLDDEEMVDVEVPEYAQVIRTMSDELSRLHSQFLATAMCALDVSGEFVPHLVATIGSLDVTMGEVER